jgi:hypothetical protein
LGSLLANGNGLVDENGNIINLPPKEDDERKAYAKSNMEYWKKLGDRFNY